MPLNLPTYTINKIDEKEHDITFHLSTIEKPTTCINCQEKSLRKYRKRVQFYFDIPIREKRVGLQIEIQSYLCKKCNKSFQEPLEDISKSHNMTHRLVNYIEAKSLQRPFTHLADEIGCVEGTIRKIFKNHVSKLQNGYKFETIRTKMLYKKSIHKTQKPKINKSFKK
jgi:transposase